MISHNNVDPCARYAVAGRIVRSWMIVAICVQYTRQSADREPPSPRSTVAQTIHQLFKRGARQRRATQPDVAARARMLCAAPGLNKMPPGAVEIDGISHHALERPTRTASGQNSTKCVTPGVLKGDAAAGWLEAGRVAPTPMNSRVSRPTADYVLAKGTSSMLSCSRQNNKYV